MKDVDWPLNRAEFEFMKSVRQPYLFYYLSRKKSWIWSCVGSGWIYRYRADLHRQIHRKASRKKNLGRRDENQKAVHYRPSTSAVGLMKTDGGSACQRGNFISVLSSLTIRNAAAMLEDWSAAFTASVNSLIRLEFDTSAPSVPRFTLSFHTKQQK